MPCGTWWIPGAERARMNRFQLAILIGAMIFFGAMPARGGGPSQMKLTLAPGGEITLVSNGGSVTVHQGSGREVLLNSSAHSDKIEVDSSNSPDGKRVDIRTHVVSQQKPSAEDAKIDYDLSVPPGAAVTISTSTAPITVEGLSGDVSLSSDTGTITVRNCNCSYLQVRGVAAPMILSNVNGGRVQITSNGGSVQLANVSGPKVKVGATSGNITYEGDFSGGGSYLLMTHNGAIDVKLPQNASVDLTARTVKGSVENDFPLQSKSHTPFVLAQGRAFAGTSNSGSSSVELQSFSGKIRVMKQ
jgi:DUF4097 and DUF4098 domain-containing protein YvlB